MIPFTSEEYERAAGALTLLAEHQRFTAPRAAAANGELARAFAHAAELQQRREMVNVTDEHSNEIPVDGKRRAL